jgi:hypothetical protein
MIILPKTAAELNSPPLRANFIRLQIFLSRPYQSDRINLCLRVCASVSAFSHCGDHGTPIVTSTLVIFPCYSLGHDHSIVIASRNEG